MVNALILLREIDGHPIGQRRADGYVNATALCKAAGKEWSGYSRNQTTEDFLSELEAVLQICRTALIQVRQGGEPSEQGTWVHPDIAIHLAQWCSARFAVQVSRWVRELLTEGRVEIAPTPTEDPIIDSLMVSRRFLDNLIATRRLQRQMEAELCETRSRVDAHDSQLLEIDSKVEEAGARAEAAMRRAEGNHGYCSVLGYYKRSGREVSVPEASAHGKRLTRICVARGVHIQDIHDPRFGRVNTYPEAILCEYFAQVWTAESN